MQPGIPDFVRNYVPVAIEGFKRDQENGLLVQCGGDAMMGNGSTIGGGGWMGLEQFVSYDPADDASVEACIKHMEDAWADCRQNGIPPGKEVQYLSIGWSDERFFNDLAGAPQTFVFNFNRQIKQAYDPNSLGDRNYPWLPEGWGKAAH